MARSLNHSRPYGLSVAGGESACRGLHCVVTIKEVIRRIRESFGESWIGQQSDALLSELGRRVASQEMPGPAQRRFLQYQATLRRRVVDS